MRWPGSQDQWNRLAISLPEEPLSSSLSPLQFHFVYDLSTRLPLPLCLPFYFNNPTKVENKTNAGAAGPELELIPSHEPLGHQHGRTTSVERQDSW